MKTDIKGFSLVELIIVIAIMGVLLTVLAPFFLNYLGKSQLAVCRENRDRLKKDMYEELIAFKEGDLEASAYLDEYMEKAGRKKVSENTYEGICPTTGVVTFSIDDINSVESISIHASCSVHGGDDIENINSKPASNSNSITYESIYRTSDIVPFTSNKQFLINKNNVSGISLDKRGEVYPYVYITDNDFKNQAVGTTGVLTLAGQDQSTVVYEYKQTLINEYAEVLYEKTRRDNPKLTDDEVRNLCLKTATNFYDDSTNHRALNSAYVVSEVQMSLSDMYNKSVPGENCELKSGSEVEIKQYLYVITQFPSQISGMTGNATQGAVLVGSRTVTGKIKRTGVQSKNRDAMKALIEGKESTFSSESQSVLDIDPTSIPSFTEVKWNYVDNIEIPYTLVKT